MNQAGLLAILLQPEQRFYIRSLNTDAAKFNTIIRSHWGIENKLHWCLDVIFNEGQSRVRKNNGAENLSILRRVELNMLSNSE